jgi:hypothetical protein
MTCDVNGDQINMRWFHIEVDQSTVFRDWRGWQLKGGDLKEDSIRLQSRKKILNNETPMGKIIVLLALCAYCALFFFYHRV